jgi:hypothetical protein
MDKKFVYVIAATAIAGYGLGEIDLGPAQAAKEVRPQQTVMVELSPEEAVVVRGLIASSVGNNIKTEYTLDKNSITADMVCDANLFPYRAFSLHCSEDNTKMGLQAVVAYPGQYVPVADLATLAVETPK